MPLVLISSNPIFVTFFFVLAGSFSVLITFHLIKKHFFFLSAIFAAGLFATSAWPILFSRKIWAQNLLPIYSALILWLSYQFFYEKKNRAGGGMILLSLWAAQIHFSGFLMIPWVFLILFLAREQLKMKEILLGFLGGVIPLVPYLLFQIKNGFADFSLLLSGKFNQLAFFDPHSFTSPFRIMAGFYFARVLQADYQEFLNFVPFQKEIMGIFNLQSLLVIAGLIGSIFLVKKTLPLWSGFLTMMAFSFISRRPALPFYEEPYFPFLFAFMGIALWQIWQLGKIGRMISSTLFFFFLGANLIFIFSFFNFVHQKQQINGDYGLVYRQKEQLVQREIKDWKYHPRESQLAMIYRVIYSIYSYDQDENQYFPQKELIPVVEYELRNVNLPQKPP